ncbi:hypothetical protein pEaSNUABM5_00325 [Erwinia phage pEa_SNUABM_5]|uniref:Uncharacterized protein n=1 Tax=Erwinia phage pEa_SNUABM_5 TaxID=2797313 RepID=A0A7T8IW71_9CAUD|nr:hypothetical protein MPK73_gp325 [Erwinia phage pEa_SNUABM_5]QQO90467.1 hypothetical protein pEaSNUABM5_00325 [Erwinia phage pEa_SNUABM_5]
MTRMNERQKHEARNSDPYDWHNLEIDITKLLLLAEDKRKSVVFAPMNLFPKFTEYNNLGYVLHQLNDFRLSSLMTENERIKGHWIATDGDHLDYVIFLRLPDANTEVDVFDPRDRELVKGRMLSPTFLCMPENFDLFKTESR